MKRLFSIALAAALLWAALPGAGAERAPGVSAASAVLMDADSGRVLYEKDGHTRRPIASITKLMTALTALESGHSLDETVTVAREWTGAEGSSLYLRPGERIPLETLLYGLMLRSGNDAALAIAGWCGGSVEGFVAQMNQKARELGMEDTAFINPNGLNEEGHYSSAWDMALLARACLDNEILAKIAATRSITLGTYTFTNHNKLLWRYEGCIGLKTGYTEGSGRTLVSAARREGTTLICVTLNAPSDWADHTALLDWGFASYEARTLARAGERVGQLPVSGGLIPVCPVETAGALTAALAAGETAEVAYELDETALEAPVRAGTRVGEAVCYVNSEELARLPLIAAADVPRDQAGPSGWLGGIWERITNL
ncbi:D-alanyl-D-alanine carboxypeptidase [Colidextribacter sp. OB.20]|uniref:D-alanyl-D-alanine carboxypeptidase family protein n=1 Tax=Colidextribacter sp. OB.20 TaxID=2304568 RepID=UPI0013721D68|nr:D-alanyl-D-alanine carboxypeptidase family protein [Colidextribacter sp. OB.20]NBI08534.1 D-alanyl-D-alanine carboxypeptidase [Colidextribacter sp. OB.20]